MSGSDHERGARRLLAALGLLRGGERRGSETRPRRARIEPTTRAEIQRRTVFGADGADGLPACVPALGPASTRMFPRQCPLERSRARILPTHRRSHARRRARVHRVRRINGLLTTFPRLQHTHRARTRAASPDPLFHAAPSRRQSSLRRAHLSARRRVSSAHLSRPPAAPYRSSCSSASFASRASGRGVRRRRRRRGDAATRRRGDACLLASRVPFLMSLDSPMAAKDFCARDVRARVGALANRARWLVVGAVDARGILSRVS